MKKFLTLFLFVGMLFVVVACDNGDADDNGNGTGDNGGGTEETGNGENGAGEDISVGLSMSTLGNPFFVFLSDQVVEAAEAAGMSIEVADAQDDSATQINDIEDLLLTDIDVLIINPTDSAAIVTAVEAANEAGIPVITIDRSVDGGDVVTSIVSDNVGGGVMAAEYLVETLGEGAYVVEISGIPGASATRDRGDGFHSIADDQLNVLASQAGNFNRTDALNVMEDLLQAHQDIVGVFAQNDEMALGAMEAINASSRDIIVIGFDGSAEALDAIRAGELDSTIVQQFDVMAQLAIEAALDALAGESVEPLIYVPVRVGTQETE